MTVLEDQNSPDDFHSGKPAEKATTGRGEGGNWGVGIPKSESQCHLPTQSKGPPGTGYGMISLKSNTNKMFW